MSIFNPWTFKRYMGIVIAIYGGAIAFYTGEKIGGNVWWAIGALCVAMPVFIIICSMILSTPFSQMLEGSGLLTMTQDSTGHIRFFITKLDKNYLTGDKTAPTASGYYDRNLIHYLEVIPKSLFKGKAYFSRGDPLMYDAPVTTPQSPEVPLSTPKPSSSSGFEEYLNIKIETKKIGDARFQFSQYPVLIYNPQLKTFITKDWFGGQEKAYFANYVIMFLERKVEELTLYTREFARAVVDKALRKEGGANWANWLFWIVLFIGIAALAWWGLPKIWPSIQGMMGNVGGTIKQSTSGITPR